MNYKCMTSLGRVVKNTYCVLRLLKNAETTISELQGRRGESVESDARLTTDLENKIKDIQDDADRRVAQAEEAARTAQEALKMIMSIQKK